MLYILSLCTILPEPLRSTAPHQLCHVRHVRFGLLMTSLMLLHCLLIPRACCDPIATCCAACDAAAADALPCDAQTRCELRIQLRTCGTLCANCASTPLHSSHFPYALPQHHLPLQDPSLDPMRVLQCLPALCRALMKYKGEKITRCTQVLTCSLPTPGLRYAGTKLLSVPRWDSLLSR